MSEDERRVLDNHNLTLQSLLYGKDYYSKEVHFCKEFKTPNLTNAIDTESFNKRFKNIQPNMTEQQHN